jgi:hypothetical protein
MDKVKLTADSLGETREFEFSHAQALLELQAKRNYDDWKLDDNRYTLEDGIIKPSGNTKESKKQSTNTASAKSSE